MGMPGGPLTRVPQPVAFMQAPYDVDAARDSYYAAFGNVDYSDCVGGPAASAGMPICGQVNGTTMGPASDGSGSIAAGCLVFDANQHYPSGHFDEEGVSAFKPVSGGRRKSRGRGRSAGGRGNG